MIQPRKSSATQTLLVRDLGFSNEHAHTDLVSKASRVLVTTGEQCENSNHLVRPREQAGPWRNPPPPSDPRSILRRIGPSEQL